LNVGCNGPIVSVSFASPKEEKFWRYFLPWYFGIKYNLFSP